MYIYISSLLVSCICQALESFQHKFVEADLSISFSALPQVPNRTSFTQELNKYLLNELKKFLHP